MTLWDAMSYLCCFFSLKLVCPFVPYLFQMYLINYCEHVGERRFNYACLPTSPIGCINYHVYFLLTLLKENKKT